MLKNLVLNRLIIEHEKITNTWLHFQVEKKVHFGSTKYPDYFTHKDKDRRDKYLARATKIKNKQGELTYNNPESANFWSVNLLWPKNDLKEKKKI